jgi:hypothetical protein
MKLPNFQHAVIDPRKLRDYCLNLENPRGKHKAKLFKAILGITGDNVEELVEILWQAISQTEAVLGELDGYGQRYVVDFLLTRQGNTALIRSAWIIRVNEDVPRLISCYILKKS